jgi:hypothetical protein
VDAQIEKSDSRRQVYEHRQQAQKQDKISFTLQICCHRGYHVEIERKYNQETVYRANKLAKICNRLFILYKQTCLRAGSH